MASVPPIVWVPAEGDSEERLADRRAMFAAAAPPVPTWYTPPEYREPIIPRPAFLDRVGNMAPEDPRKVAWDCYKADCGYPDDMDRAHVTQVEAWGRELSAHHDAANERRNRSEAHKLAAWAWAYADAMLGAESSGLAAAPALAAALRAYMRRDERDAASSGQAGQNGAEPEYQAARAALDRYLGESDPTKGDA